jgi:glucose-6-phosphate 1-epimerase
MEGATVASHHQFEIPETAQVVAGNGGMPKVRITSPEVAGEMYLHGAHVTSWKPAGSEEVLFLSSQSPWEHGRAIRGGIPICFPWFGGKADDPTAPAHGFVRTKSWQLESIAQVGSGVAVTMFTESDESTKRWWPVDFRLVHRVSFLSQLHLQLVLTNTGRTALRFEEALHTYHRVANIRESRLLGLDGIRYLDKTDRNREKTQQGAIVIESETDRVYLDTQVPVELEDRIMRRRTRVTKQNSRTTVVWNPWVEKAHSLSDFADDEWRQMICVECSNVGDFALVLAPGEQHTMEAIVKVADF